MPAFEYNALNRKGKEESGVLEGDTARQIRQQLRNKELTPLDVKEVRDNKAGSNIAKVSRGNLKTADLALFTRQLATLVGSGTPLEESLGTIARQTHKKSIKRVIMGVRGRLMEGHSLVDSLNQFPSAFPSMYRATVAAGEQSGHLDAILERLADYTEEHQAVQQKIMSALIYPIVLIVMAIAVVAGLLGYVVPKVVDIFETLDQELPLLTRIMINLSEIVKTAGPFILVATVIAAFLFAWLYKKKGRFNYRVDLVMLKLPILGELIRGKQTAAFSRTLGILASSGVPVLTAMKHSADVVTNSPMNQAITKAADRVREGASISGSLLKSNLFPPMTLHLIASGESSGNLEKMLERAASQQERETSGKVTTFVSLFEPLLIVVMGIIVFTIIMAILMPIFDLNDLVQ